MTDFSLKGPIYMLWLVLLFFIVVITLVFKVQNIGFSIDSLQSETRFLVFSRKMLSSADCLAFEQKDMLITDEPDYNVYYKQRIYPGVLDAYKLENWKNMECIKQDDPEISLGGRAYNPFERPAILYSIVVQDVENDNTWFFTKTHDRSYFIPSYPDPDSTSYRGVPCMWATPCNSSLGDKVYQYSYPVFIVYQDKQTGDQVKHLGRFFGKFCEASPSPQIVSALIRPPWENCIPETETLLANLLFGFKYCGVSAPNPDNFRWDLYDCVQYHTAEKLGEATQFEVQV
ncbi:MAG: hypothetical protein GOU97_00845 [Nanoarchaeota archaeon]|nr:hypothetical protein [Nanoarchaeota archaeon]